MMFTKKQLVAKIADLLEQGTALSGKHDTYVETYVEKGNEQLGVLLSEVLAYAQEVLAMPNLEQVIKKMRRTLSREYGIKTQINSPNLNIIVRYVIRKNRKTAHVYARVLQTAIDAKVGPEALSEFIKSNGGVERIRQSTVNIELIKAKEEKQQYLNDNAVAYARFYFEDRAKKPLATFTIPKEYESHIFDKSRSGYFRYMICYCSGNNYLPVDALPMYPALNEQLMIQSYNYLHSRNIFTDDEKASKEVARQGVIAWRKRLAADEVRREKEQLEREQAAELKKLANQTAANDDQANDLQSQDAKAA